MKRLLHALAGESTGALASAYAEAARERGLAHDLEAGTLAALLSAAYPALKQQILTRPEDVVAIAHGKMRIARDLRTLRRLALSFAVNLSPEESRTAPMAADALSNLGVPVKSAPTTLAAAPKADQAATLMTAANELEGRQKLWRWVLLAALGFVLIETWLAGRLSFGARNA